MLAPVSVREVMTENVVTVEAAASIEAATQKLRSADVGSMVVLEDGMPVGILTERDLLDVLAAGEDPGETTVEAAMSDQLVTVGPEESVETAVDRLRENSIRRLPVVEDDTLVGIVTTTDLSYYLPELGMGGRPDPAERSPGTTEVSYEDEDWETEFLDADRGGLSPGDRVRFTKTISESDVETFAEITGDTNRLHLEEAFAADTRFGQRIVHGGIVAGLVSAALARIPGLTIYLSQSLSFREAVPLDSEITAVCEVLEDLEGKKYGMATRVYHEGTLVVDGEATILVDEIVTNLPAK